MVVRRLAGIVAVAFGVAGFAACVVGAYGVWRAQARLDRANDQAFDAIDRGLTVVQDRVPAVRERVHKARITTDELGKAARLWAASEARERVVAELQVEARTATVAGYLQAADVRLDSAATAVRDVRRMLELAQTLGAEVDPAVTDRVLALIAALRDKLDDAERAVEEVRRIAVADGESAENRAARVAKLLLRIVVTLADVETRLGEFAERLTEVRGEARRLHDRTGDAILLGAVACYALLTWVAAGQAALCWWGVTRYRRRPVGDTA
jgi:hypothetical protein